jgi:hypothetical protein
MDGTAGTRARRRGGTAAAVALLAVTAIPAVAGDRPGVVGGSATVEPHLGRGLMPEVARKLRLGFETAISQVGGVEPCGALFRELGADPVVLLGRSFYFPAEVNWGKQACPDGVLASTQVGSPLTMVCKGFGQTSKKEAAVVLLHEALHFAGLNEQPHDPSAMTASQINDLVRERCGL